MAQRLELEDVTIAYEERAADGSPTVVLVHGLGGSLHSWWAQLAACEAAKSGRSPTTSGAPA